MRILMPSITPMVQANATPKIAAAATTAPIGTGPTCQKNRLTVTSALLYTPTTNRTKKKQITIT
jgi:hypothetical protein